MCPFPPGMGSQVAPSPELADCLHRLRSILEQFIRIVDALIAVTVDHESAASLRQERAPIPNQVAEAVPLMLQAVGSSSYTLVRLSDAPGLHTRDCYSIARSIVELAVNICYIIAEGPTVAEQALRHARQKAFRDLERMSEIGDSVIRLVYAGRPDPSIVAGLEADIAEFTSRSGREKGWVDESIDDRIDVLGRKFGDSVLKELHFARFMVYRHSSEVLHGTLFSAMYFFGITTPSDRPLTPGGMAEGLAQQHMLILFAAILSLSAVVRAFHDAYGFCEADRRRASLMDALREIPYLRQDQESVPPE